MRIRLTLASTIRLGLKRSFFGLAAAFVATCTTGPVLADTVQYTEVINDVSGSLATVNDFSDLTLALFGTGDTNNIVASGGAYENAVGTIDFEIGTLGSNGFSSVFAAGTIAGATAVSNIACCQVGFEVSSGQSVNVDLVSTDNPLNLLATSDGISGTSGSNNGVTILTDVGPLVLDAYAQAPAEWLAAVSSTPLSPTPLPSSLPLLATGLGGLGLLCWIRKRRAPAVA